TGSPDSTRQTHFFGECRASAYCFELGSAGRRMPGLCAASDPTADVDAPKRAVVPIERLADGLKNPLDGLAQSRRFRKRTCGDILGRQAPIASTLTGRA